MIFFYSTNKKVKFYSYFEYMKIENQTINYSKCSCLIRSMRTCKNKLKHDWWNFFLSLIEEIGHDLFLKTRRNSEFVYVR